MTVFVPPPDAQVHHYKQWRLALWPDSLDQHCHLSFAFYLSDEATQTLVRADGSSLGPQHLLGYLTPDGVVALITVSFSNGIRTHLNLLEELAKALRSALPGLKWREP